MYDDELVAQLHALLQGYAIRPEHVHALVHLLDETGRGRPSALPPRADALTRNDPSPLAINAAFLDLGLLEQVEHFKVHRGRDTVLHRQVSLLMPADHPESTDRVRREALLLARLRHPCVEAVLQQGTLRDGTPFVALERSETTPLSEALRSATEATALEILVRTVRLLARVSEALEYAHQQGLIHRALCDRTVQSGPFGRVSVTWWGWALDLHDPDQNAEVDDEALIRALTTRGAAVPPEVTDLDRDAQGPWTDVYGVGALLRQALERLPLAHPPETLKRLAAAATQDVPDRRIQRASSLAEALTAWCERAGPIARAKALVRQADSADEDGAEACLHGALQLDSDNAEARGRLCALYRRRVRAALRAGARDRAAEALLSSVEPNRTRSVETVSLRSSPSGAHVTLWGWVEADRHLRPELIRTLGTTPIEQISLVPGSYLLRLEADGHEPVRYPLLVELAEDEPDPATSHRVPLPPRGAVSPLEVYVPGGWTLWGDPDPASGAAPWTRSLTPSFVARRTPLSAADLDGSADPQRRMDAPPLDDLDASEARRLAELLATRDGLPWRLPTEEEWERLARGGDGRRWPWTARKTATLCPIDDVSPFDVRALCTGIAEWVETPEGPVLKGVVWDSPAQAASRALLRPPGCRAGVRLVRTWEHV